MKIILMTDAFPPRYQTSVGSIVINSARQLKTQGHQILIITTTHNKKEAGRANYKDLDVWRVYADFSPRLRSYLGLYNPQSVGAVKKIFQEFSPDIIHAHLIHYWLSYHCLKLAKAAGAKVFLTSHDVNLFHFDKFDSFIDKKNLNIPENLNYRVSWRDEFRAAKKRYNPFRRIIIKYYLKSVNKIFSVSDALKKALADNGIFNVATVYNAVDASAYQSGLEEVNDFKKKYNLADKKIIFFGGRMSRYKGGEQILSALALIIREVPNAVLLIAAQKSGYWGKMEKIIKKLNLAEHVICPGWLLDDDMVIAYNSIDVCVTPSICLDTFNLFNIEAMAAKKPVVGTCFGGTPEVVINGTTGYIVNPLNIKMLAEKIIELLADPQKAEGFGEAGYQRVLDRFSLENQANKILDFYQKY